MRNFNSLIPIVTITLAAGCDDAATASAPDRADRLESEEPLFRAGPGGIAGGSTRLNTAMLFQDGMPLAHFDRAGAPTQYDDDRATRVTFLGLRLRTGIYGAFVDYPAGSNQIQIDDGLLRLNGGLRSAGKLVGSEWQFSVSDAELEPRVVTVRITGAATVTVPGGVEVPLYNFSLDASTAFYEGGPYSACKAIDALTHDHLDAVPAADTPRGTTNQFNRTYSSVLYGGLVVDAHGGVSLDPAKIYLGCVSGAIGKAALWGYPPWAASDQEVGRRELEAVSRVIRADYCADGISHTHDGTPIQVRDRFSSVFGTPSAATEAVWGDAGSLCLVSHDRLASPALHDCGGRLTADCNQLAAQWLLGAPKLMWTKSAPSPITMPPPQQACDVVSQKPGCADPGIETVVCTADPYCCDIAWDPACVGEVTSLGAAAEACCVANGGPGCGDPWVSNCVGSYDPYCTQSSWDSMCASEVELLGCGLCR